MSILFCDQITERIMDFCYTIIKKNMTEDIYEKTL